MQNMRLGLSFSWQSRRQSSASSKLLYSTIFFALFVPFHNSEKQPLKIKDIEQLHSIAKKRVSVGQNVISLKA